MNNTGNENFPHKNIYSSSSSSSITALDFFARDDVALGFFAAACFVDAGRYDTSDHGKSWLEFTNLSLLACRLVNVVILFMFHLSQFLREILARSFGLILMVETQAQYNKCFHESMMSDLGGLSLCGAFFGNGLASTRPFWFLCILLPVTFLEDR